jgi:hypothetical protein
MELEQVPVFAVMWAGVVRMARLDRYRELQHLLLMADVIKLVGKDALLGALITAQEMAGNRGDPNAPPSRSRSTLLISPGPNRAVPVPPNGLDLYSATGWKRSGSFVVF